MYKISKYSYDQAEKLHVDIKPSSIKNKKIDVFKNGQKIASIGHIKYNDYTTFLAVDKKLADERRKLYKKRHEKDRNVKNSNGYFADKILW